VKLLIKLESNKNRITTNIVLIGIFSALWVVLNLTIAPLGFSLTGLPFIHSAIVFLTLILTVWATEKYGAASLVCLIGSAIVLLLGGPIFVLGFVLASLPFDAILLLNRHKVNMKTINVVIIFIAAIVCSYFAGFLNGVLFLGQALLFVLTFWSGWTALGGVIGALIALPTIALLERAQVKRVQIE
jgi:hypothetical protein